MIDKSLFNTQASLALMVVLIGMSACKDLPTSGNYRGDIQFNRLTGQGVAEKVPVQMDLIYSHHHLTATVMSAETHTPLIPPLIISQSKKDTLALLVPNFIENKDKTFILIRVPNSLNHCYQSQDNTPLNIDKTGAIADSTPLEIANLCFDNENFSLDIQGERDLHLYGSKFQPQRKLEFEESRSLTVLEGVDRILHKNYDVQESIQSLVRAQQSVLQAYLNFLPHTSTTGMLKFAYFSVEFLEGELEIETFNRLSNDFVSFIFPGRWIKAKELNWKARAEKLTNTLFQINMGTAVQSMSVALNTHRQLKNELQTLHDELTEVLRLAQKLANQGCMDSNSILTIQIALSDLSINLWQAQNLFYQDRMTLSQMLGFENPETVENMELGAETTPLTEVQFLDSHELEIEKKKYAELSLKNSFELRQLEFLHRAAVLNEKNMYVEWADVNSSLDLGFKLIPQSKINKSLINSVEIKSEKTRQSLIAKAYNLVRDRNILRETYTIFDTSWKSRKERLTLLFDRLKMYAEQNDKSTPLSVQASDIRGSVRDVTLGIIGALNSQAALLIDQTELDRIALKGVYEKFLPQLDGSEIKK